LVMENNNSKGFIMKKIFIILAAMFILNSCSSSSNTETQTPENQRKQFAYLSCLLSTTSGQRAYVRGELYADSSVLFDYCDINGLKVTNHTYTPDCMKFGDNNECVTSNLQNLVCKLKTSAGTLNGSISGLPVTPLVIEVSHLLNDTLKLNDTLTVTWENTHVDFYRLAIAGQSQIGSFNIDTLVTGNSIKLSYNTFFRKYNGKIYNFYLMPVIGPIPNSQAKGNLKGTSESDGYGFFYFYGPTKYRETVIHLGLGTNTKSAPERCTEAELTEQFNKSVLKKLGVSK